MTKWILASMASMVCALFIGGCAVGSTDSTEEPIAEPGLEPQTIGVMRETIYYAEAAHINQVGYCVFSSCPPKGTHCSGTKTIYTEVYEDPCSY